MSKKIGRTEGLATLELMEGLKQLKLNPRVYRSEKQVHDPESVVDDASAEFISEYVYTALPHQSSTLSPEYSWLGKTYWHADTVILKEIQDELKIRYPKDYPDKPMSVIPADEIDPTNYSDPFFTQFKLNRIDSTKKMKGGIYTFTLSDPVDRLLFYSYMYHPDCEVFGQEVGVFKSGRNRWRLMMPEIEKKEKLIEADSKIKAIALLDKKRGIEAEQMRAIAEVMKLRDIDYQTSTDEDIRVALLTQAANNNKKLVGWEKPANEVFTYLGDELTKGKLNKLLILVRAMNYNVITRTGNTYRFNEEEIPEVYSDAQLYEHFLEKKGNNDKLRDIEDHVKARHEIRT